jgi:hypothetical protein
MTPVRPLEGITLYVLIDLGLSPRSKIFVEAKLSIETTLLKQKTPIPSNAILPHSRNALASNLRIGYPLVVQQKSDITCVARTM